MGLSRDELLSMTTPVHEVEIPEFGGRIHVKAIPMGHDRLYSFVNGPVDRGDDGPDFKRERLGKDASKAEKQAADVAERIVSTALASKWAEPTADEKSARKIVGAFILGVCGPDGEPQFSWEDADTVRNTLNWNGVCHAATIIFGLSGGLTLEEAKRGFTGEP